MPDINAVCTGCNRCNSCNSCQGSCNTCQKCDKCQTICETNSDALSSVAGGFSWPVTPKKDATISQVWTAAAWNDLRARISAAIAKGNVCSSSSQSGYRNNMSSVSKGDIVTAAIYNSAKDALSQFGGSGAKSASKSGVITYDYAAALKSQYDSGKISDKACDQCNVKCETCDSCNVRCNSCNDCVTCVTCISADVCNTCQVGDEFV